MSKLLQERWSRLAFAPNSTTVVLNETDEAHPNSKIYDKCQTGYKKKQGAKRGEKGSCIPEEDEILIDESDENSFMNKIAHAAIDGEDSTIIGGKEYDVDMDIETAEEITGEKAVKEGITRWYQMINEDGFDKEKKDKMKCNSPRRLRDGEPGHGDKSKVVKACDPGSDDEKIVKFGDPDMPVQAHHADNKASFRARHKCSEKSMSDDWDAAGYWSCKEW